jgi:glutamate-1-semialdehyde 2,1-aminomutase
MGKSQKLYQKAKKIIPGGTQLLTKRPEMLLPDLWPAYYKKAKGCEVWDLDNNHYYDMSYMGIGSCILGYANDVVDKAVKNAIRNGSMCTLNCPEEVKLAEKLCDIHPWASKVRYARTGGEAMSIAVRIARAYTDKDIILFCGYHGWHDWYLSATLSGNSSLDWHLLPDLEPRGIPESLMKTAIPFKYNDMQSFLDSYKKYKGRIAAVVMEPMRASFPKDNFLIGIREVTQRDNIVLVFDEITSGWRSSIGGIHKKLNVCPDIAVFAKAMSNGYPMAAIIGNKVMNAAQDTFISSTYWTERIGPVAALATIGLLEEYEKKGIAGKPGAVGRVIMRGWQQAAEKYNIAIKIDGIGPLCHFSFDDLHMIRKTLFTQCLLEDGFLATTAFYGSYGHSMGIAQKYLDSVDKAFKVIKETDDPLKLLKGPVCHDGLRRLT